MTQKCLWKVLWDSLSLIFGTCSLQVCKSLLQHSASALNFSCRLLAWAVKFSPVAHGTCRNVKALIEIIIHALTHYCLALSGPLKSLVALFSCGTEDTHSWTTSCLSLSPAPAGESLTFSLIPIVQLKPSMTDRKIIHLESRNANSFVGGRSPFMFPSHQPFAIAIQLTL